MAGDPDPTSDNENTTPSKFEGLRKGVRVPVSLYKVPASRQFVLISSY
jgi:hypothetical protein